MVFYLKYRPQTVEELDTTSIRQNLGAVLSSGKVPHAFLFTGPRGLGKTSAARIVAKSVNCLKGEKGKICGKCSACLSISEGRNLDVLEIDAASNRGIDEIRDLREKIKLAPSSLRFKVYIIDEVHMLTNEAFNALLKTLEEPPAHAIFVLCTTEAYKLPQTVISRCLRFDFKRASRDNLIRSLERIVKREKLKVEKGALEEITQGADGSFRDATKILEQVVLSGKPINKEQIKEILGETQNLKPEELLKFLAQKDIRGAVLEINRLTEMGENLRVYTEKILALLHQILMSKVGVEGESGKPELADLWEKKEVVRVIELFSQACGDLKNAVIPQLPLELAVVEYCEQGEVISDSPTTGPFGLHPHPTSSPPPVADQQNPTIKASSHPASPVGEEISRIWPKIIEATKEYNHTLAGVLRGCRPQKFDGKILTVETSYKFHTDKLNEPKIRELLGKVLVNVLGENVIFKCVLSEKNDVLPARGVKPH